MISLGFVGNVGFLRCAGCCRCFVGLASRIVGLCVCVVAVNVLCVWFVIEFYAYLCIFFLSRCKFCLLFLCFAVSFWKSLFVDNNLQ